MGGAARGEARKQLSLEPCPSTPLRVVLTAEDGTKAETFIDLKNTSPNERGWRKVDLPVLVAINR